MDNKTADIAIVVPVFRITYLHKLLHSLAFQSDRRFRVYLADDASGEDVAAFASEFEDSLDIRCQTFVTNAGATSLARHLERAMQMLRDESWVVFLSDDNELSKYCIGRLRKAIARHPEYDVFHWNTEIIGPREEVLETPAGLSRSEKPARLFRKIFYKDVPATLSSFAFRRSVLEEKLYVGDGLLRTDLQTVFSAAGEKGVRTVPLCKLLRRRHPESMASNPSFRRKLVYSTLGFLKWSEEFFGEDYPVSAGDRMELFAKYAARLLPETPADEIKDLYMQFAVFDGPIRRMKGSSIIKRAIRERTEFLKENA